MLNVCKIFRTHWIGPQCVTELYTTAGRFALTLALDGEEWWSGTHEEAVAIAARFPGDRGDGTGRAHVDFITVAESNPSAQASRRGPLRVPVPRRFVSELDAHAEWERNHDA